MHVGNELKMLRHRKGWTQTDLAAAAKVSLSWVQKAESSPTRPPSRPAFKKAVEALGATPDAIDPTWNFAAESLPAGIASDMFTEPIPEWEIDVRAGPWASVPICELNPNDPEQRCVIETGRFRLRIIGDCMEPDYQSGQTVEFRIVRVDLEGLEPGADYVVCRNDGLATFKRLVSADDEVITLGAVNQKDYPGVLEVSRQEVARIARVAYRLQLPPKPTPVKILKQRQP